PSLPGAPSPTPLAAPAPAPSRRGAAGAAPATFSRSHTRTPRTNGKAERFIQTLLRRWAYRRPYRTSAIRAAALGSWLHEYNHRRPHRALGMKPPIARLRAAREQSA